MLQLRLEGQLTRNQYHQLDLNRLRRYGEEHCFALVIDDSDLDILPTVFLDTSLEHETYGMPAPTVGSALDGGTREGILAPSMSGGQVLERFSPREELVALADEWIAATNDEQEKKALRATKEELLAALDKIESRAQMKLERQLSLKASILLSMGSL